MIQTTEPTPAKPSPYVPAGMDTYVFEKFEGVNTNTSRVGVPDEQAFWIDGFMPIDQRNLRTLLDVGSILYSAPAATTIAAFYSGNIGSTAYLIVLLNNGRVDAVNTATAAVSVILAAGSVTNADQFNFGVSQWGNQFIILVAQQANGYWLWDGTTTYSPGGAAPAAFGGTMPTGVGGSTVETYQGRVWIATGPTLAYSAPGNAADFSAPSGGGTQTSTDSYLQNRYVQLISANSFLYLIGDSSVSYISNVQTSGSPPVTTFTVQNADPQVGSPYPGSVELFGRNILFANSFGVHVCFGGAVQKVSEPMDGVYNTADVPFNISSAEATIFGKRVWMCLQRILDPLTQQFTNKLLMWDGKKKWWTSEQSLGLNYVHSQEINSVVTAWGTNGQLIRPLFQSPSTAFTKRVASRFFDSPSYMFTKTTNRFWGILQWFGIDVVPVTTTVLIESDAGAAASYPIATPAAPGIVSTPPQAVGQNGRIIGMQLVTTASSMSVVSMTMDAVIAGYRG